MKNNQKWGFSLSGRKVENNKQGRNNERLPELGKHEVELLDFRTTNKEGKGSRWWWADFKVISGPSPEGFLFSQGYCPEEAKVGGKMSYPQAKALEEGKVVKMVGAFYGYNATEADQQLGDDEIGYALGQPDIGVVSPFAGRRLIVDHTPWTSKNKNEQGEFKKGTNYNFYPLLVDGVSPYASAPAAELSLEQLLEKHGFVLHPSDSNWVYNPSSNDQAINVQTFLESFK